MRFFAAALIFFGAASSAQTPEVPHKMHFAGMTLTIRDDARREIQKDVDALTQSPRYFNLKVERAKTYFPVIEKIFTEERVPLDFKFLVLQESALIPDAVSVSNAVGFWQFKEETAKEMGLRVDKEIDERMNIVSASRGAASYFKKSNTYFNNWLVVLQSYQMGIGGTRRALGEEQNGLRHMEINSSTYWYIKKYLAHKVAFENALGGEPQVKITPFITSKVTSIQQIAKQSNMDEQKLLDYNKWARQGSIPSDRSYTVVIPSGDITDFNTLFLASSKKNVDAENSKPRFINNLPVIEALEAESITMLARRGKIDLAEFIKFNDASIDQRVQPGQVFYLAKKKKRVSKPGHVVNKTGENLWTISQAYGIRLKTLRKYNNYEYREPLKRGVYIRFSPAGPSGEGLPLEVDVFSPFEWDVPTTEANTVLIIAGLPSEAVFLIPKKDSLPEVALPDLHIVVQGETLYSIARKYDLFAENLRLWNGLAADAALKSGQKLKLSKTPTSEGPGDYHEVKTSDTLYSIARQYGLTVKELMDLNNRKDFAVTPGERLKVK